MAYWRVFPWNPDAAPGEPFSVQYVPPAGIQRGGRFDLERPPVLYLAETPGHAVAEVLQRHRGTPITSEHLVRSDAGEPGIFHPLSLVQATLPESVEAQIPDFADPTVLLELGIRPDQLASHNRDLTRAIARRVHAAADGYAGFRWWSALTGEWHVTVLFSDRVDAGSIDYATPEPLHIDHPVVREAARFLNISLAPKRREN